MKSFPGFCPHSNPITLGGLDRRLDWSGAAREARPVSPSQCPSAALGESPRKFGTMLEQVSRGVLSKHRAVLSFSSRIQRTMADVIQNAAHGFGNCVKQTCLLKHVLRNADPCAQNLGPGKTGFENRMRSSLPTRTNKAQIGALYKRMSCERQDVWGRNRPDQFPGRQRKQAPPVRAGGDATRASRAG